MQHEPCRLLSDFEIAHDLVGANAVLAVHDQPNRGEPFIERDGRIFKHALGLHAELLVAILRHALPDAAAGQV